MKTLSATELAVVRGLIRDLMEIIDYDDVGITWELEDKARASAQILGIVVPNSEIETD